MVFHYFCYKSFVFFHQTLYFVGFYVLLLFDIVISIQIADLTEITSSADALQSYFQSAFLTAGYLIVASAVALKCLDLVPDLASWMIPEGDTAFSTRNFGAGIAQQAKASASGIGGSIGRALG